MMPELDLVKTGISGLDVILSSGIPRGNVILLEGGIGTGKTTLGVEFVYRGASMFGEPGIIVLFEVSPDRLVRDAAGLGWDLPCARASATNSKSSSRHARCSARSCSSPTVCSSRRLRRSAPAAFTWTAWPAHPARSAVRSFATLFTSSSKGCSARTSRPSSRSKRRRWTGTVSPRCPKNRLPTPSSG